MVTKNSVQSYDFNYFNSNTQVKTIEDIRKQYLIKGLKDFWYKIGDNCFIIPFCNYLIVYLVSDGVRDLYLLNNKIDDILLQKDIVKFLQNNLFINSKISSSTKASSSDGNHVINNCNSRNFFGLMLSLTSDCNLKCSYCYIYGGNKKSYMSWEIAKASIDYTIKECIRNNITKTSLSFHGQGEPTLHWGVLVKSTKYFIKECKKKSLDYSLSLTTNGLMNKRQIELLKKLNFHTTISMDCATENLNVLRPMRNNNSTLDSLIETLEIFEFFDINFGIRSTVSEINVTEMYDFVRFLSKYKYCKSIHFQPLSLKGRAINKEISDYFYEDFILNFNRAKEKGYSLGIDVYYSGGLINNQKDTFCCARGKNLNFCVSTTGLVSSCYEHLDNNNDSFVYGEYTQEGFIINEEKFIQLTKSNIANKKCRSCFLYSTCKGDCYSGSSSNEVRCYINREIAKKDLFILSLSNLLKQTNELKQ